MLYLSPSVWERAAPLLENSGELKSNEMKGERKFSQLLVILKVTLQATS